jgi:NAD(P)-dependent dehydrogenase (short-subunit alcohol dehydrogenase family)
VSRRVLIAGAGGVLGHALADEFTSAGYAAVGLRRIGSEQAGTTKIPLLHCDLDDAGDTLCAVGDILAEHGPIDVLICNTSQFIVGGLAELTFADFERAWRAAMASAIACTQAVLPGMLERGSGAIIFSGATASIRGGARFAAFASAKFALRGFAQSLAREMQARKIHVVHVILDGLLGGSPSASKFGGTEDTTMDPREVARTYRWLVEQHPSVWTHEIDLRPSVEKF